jgi:hypothetical protein
VANKISLKEAERRVFHSSVNDSLWDIFLGFFFLEFVIAPFLSESMGDFWSVAVFLPFWGVIYLVTRWVRKNIVEPRIGSVKFGPIRIAKLKRFTYVMLALNIIALAVGTWAALNFEKVGGMPSYFFGLILLVGFSTAGFLLDLPRLFLYGLLLGLAPVVGEWLWVNANVTHHGFPITFGTVSGVMILIGIILFTRLLRDNPILEDYPLEKA